MYNRKDSYYKKAKQQGYKSRAAYKLIELNKKYSLIKKGDYVLDAGAAPGGWSQVALELVGDKGKVVGIDLLDIEGLENKNFFFIKGNLTDKSIIDAVLEQSKSFDIVISDYSSVFTGYLLSKKHVMFLPYDLEEYEKNIGFVLPYHEATPGPKPTTYKLFKEEIIKLLRDKTYYKEEIEKASYMISKLLPRRIGSCI